MKKKLAWNMSNPLYRYIQSKKSSSRRRASSSPSRSTNMARKKSFRRGKSSSNNSLLMTVGAAMLYGGVRSKLSAMTQQYLPSFAGQYTDEVVLGVAGWYLSKKGGLIGSLGKSALIIESASVGNQIVSGMSGSSSVGYGIAVNN